MEFKSGLNYLLSIEEKINQIDEQPEKVVTMFINDKENIVRLLNLLQSLKFNNLSLNNFIEDGFNKIEELKDFRIKREGEVIYLELKLFKNAPMKVSCSSSFCRILSYNIFNGQLKYEKIKLEEAIARYTEEKIEDNTNLLENYTKSRCLRADERDYMKLFEPYLNDISNNSRIFNRKIALSKEYSNFFYDLNLNKRKLKKTKVKLFKYKTFFKVLFMEKKYLEDIKLNIDYLKDKEGKQLISDEEENRENFKENEWVAANKQSITESYEKAFNYLKNIFS